MTADRDAAPVAAEGADTMVEEMAQALHSLLWQHGPRRYEDRVHCWRDCNDPYCAKMRATLAARPAPAAAPREGEKHRSEYPWYAWYDDRGRLGSLEEWSDDLAMLLQDEIAEDDVPRSCRRPRGGARGRGGHPMSAGAHEFDTVLAAHVVGPPVYDQGAWFVQCVKCGQVVNGHDKKTSGLCDAADMALLARGLWTSLSHALGGTAEMAALRARAERAEEECERYRERVDAATARVALLEGLLRSVEWVNSADAETLYCPRCGWTEAEGHSPACPLGTALRADGG